MVLNTATSQFPTPGIYVDSFVIADFLRFGGINKEVYLDDYRYAALKNLTRARFFAVQNLTRENANFAYELH